MCGVFVGLRGPVTACGATKYRLGDAVLRCCAPTVFTAVAGMPGVDLDPDTPSLFRFGAQYRVEPAPASVGELPYARPPRRAAARSGSSGKRGHVSRCHRVPLMLDVAAHRRLPNVAGRSGEVRRRSLHLGEPPHLGKLAQHACGALLNVRTTDAGAFVGPTGTNGCTRSGMTFLATICQACSWAACSSTSPQRAFRRPPRTGRHRWPAAAIDWSSH